MANWSLLKPDAINVNKPWKNENFNLLKAALDSAFGNLKFNQNFANDPLAFVGDLVGGDKLYNFSNLLGVDGTTAVIDACAYGLDPSESAANNTTAMQAAVDSIPIGGGMILVPPGEYEINGAVELEGTARNIDNVVIKGFGKSTKFKISSGATNGLFRLGSTSAATRLGHVVSDMCIDCGFGASNGNGVYIQRGRGCKVERVYFDDQDGATYAAVNIGIYSDDVTVAHCEIYDGEGSGILIDRGDNIVAARPTSIRIMNNMIRGMAKSGIKVTTTDGCIIDNNYIEDCGTDEDDGAIHVLIPARDDADEKDVYPITISGNIVYKGEACGVLINNAYGGNSVKGWIKGITITDTIVYETENSNNNAFKVIRVPGTGDDVCYNRNIVISSCISLENPQQGIHYQGHPEDVGTTDGDATRLSVIFGNVVMRSGQSTGIMVHSPDTDHGGTDIMKLNTIVANVSGDDRGGSATQQVGVTLDVISGGSPGWIQDHVVIGNVLHGNATEPFNDEALSTSHGHNPGY